MFKLTTEDIVEPYYDRIFKAIFASNTEDSNIAFIELVSDAIGEDVKEITILQNEPTSEGKKEKQIRYDILCKLADNTIIDVEMQLHLMPGMQERLEYYACKLLTIQENKGLLYQKFNKVYQIAILINGKMYEDENIIHKFRLYDEENKVRFKGNITVITAEAVKLKLDNIEELKPLEKWIYWFKNANNPEKREEINKLIRGSIGMEKATKVLVRYSTEGAERRAIEKDKQIQMDYYNDMEGSRLEGKAEGKAEGIEIGIEKGRTETAKNLKSLGIDVDVIAQATGLSKEEISKL